MQDATQVSSGVQELIERLRGEGVEAGRQEAEELKAAAEAQARQILGDAEAQAAEALAEARREIERERSSALEALRLAARDTRLDLKGRLESRFAAELGRLVTDELGDPQLLRQLIEALAAESGRELEGEDLAIQLPRSGGEHLDRLTQEIASGLLKRGLTLSPGDHGHGLKVRVRGQEVEVDLTDEAITRWLSSHLMPRFRHLLGGGT